MHTGLLTAGDLTALLGISKSTLYRLIKGRSFPAPLRLSPNRVAWRSSDVDAWLDRQSTAWEA